MQLNGYPLNIIYKTIKENWKFTILNIKAKNWKRLASKYKFTTVFTKPKDLRGQIRTKQKDKMQTSGAVS